MHAIGQHPQTKSCLRQIIWHHDSAPSHIAASVREFLTDQNATIASHLAYSPDLAPLDFWVFAQLKESTGVIFERIQDLFRMVNQKLKGCGAYWYQSYFKSWKVNTVLYRPAERVHERAATLVFKFGLKFIFIKLSEWYYFWDTPRNC